MYFEVNQERLILSIILESRFAFIHIQHFKFPKGCTNFSNSHEVVQTMQI